MAEKLGHKNEIRELKIGQSFTNPKSTAFHTVKYDFKPASVDTNKKATVDVAGNNQVTVTVPHLDGAGVPQTVFKGSQRPYQKECVLIIDRVTGEITLEKLGCNIQVKKTRSEYNKLHLPHVDRLSQSGTSIPDKPNASTLSSSTSSSSLAQRSQTPPTTVVGQRVSHKTKVATSSRQRKPNNVQQQQLVPKHSPLHASPSYQRSPMHTKSPKLEVQATHPSSSSATGIEPHSQSTLASLPMIGIDDSDMAPMPSITFNSPNVPPSDKNGNPFSLSDNENGIGEITDTSSSSSDSDSDSEEENVVSSKNLVKSNGYTNGTGSLKVDTQILNDDLCLSDSD